MVYVHVQALKTEFVMLASEDTPAVRLDGFRATNGTDFGDRRRLGLLLQLKELELVDLDC